MEYSKDVAQLINQEKSRHEIMYKMSHNNFAIFQIIGEYGSGKQTLCAKVAEEWQGQHNGVVIKLLPSSQNGIDDYAVFKKLILHENVGKTRFENIFQESVRGIPYVGDSLSVIIKEILEIQHDKEKFEGTLSENEHYIISKIKQLSKHHSILFICIDFDEWDLKSQKLMLRLMEYNIPLNDKETYFLITNTTPISSLKNIITDNKYLQRVPIETISDVIYYFNPNLQLDKSAINDIYDLTNGNLELIKELANSNSLSPNVEYTDCLQLIENHLNNVSSNPEALLQLLRETAFIGNETDIRLLKIFSSISAIPFEDILGEAIDLLYLSKEEYIISFVKHYIYTILEKNQYKDLHYYNSLSKCINRLYPTRYDLQMKYASRGGLQFESQNYLLLYLIKYYRENNVLYPLSPIYQEQLQTNSNYSFYIKLCNAYESYKSKNYDNAEEILLQLYSNTKEFRFEKEYLHSLVVTNKYFSLDEFYERIDVLNSYISDDFEKKHPEMYLRALMILAELYSEVSDEKEQKRCIYKIHACFAKYSTTDENIRRYEFCFKLKANAFYKIEIATRYTQTACEYFKNSEYTPCYISDYYLSLLNHAANLIVQNEHSVANGLLMNAWQLVQANNYLQNIHRDIFVNNLVISGYYIKSLSAEDSKFALEETIQFSTECADNLLIKNNIVVFTALCGDLHKALHMSKKLYQQIKYNEDADDYYRYYILNNYGILLWLNNKKEEAVNILGTASRLMPWPQNQAYFKARINHIGEMIEHSSPNKILKEDNWNSYLSIKNGNVVGSAWTFWSNLLLFSELQIWSDY